MTFPEWWSQNGGRFSCSQAEAAIIWAASEQAAGGRQPPVLPVPVPAPPRPVT